MTDYRAAPAVKAIATHLIDEYHRDLADVRIEYVFRDKASKSKGKVTLGSARRVSGLNAWLAGDRDEVSGEDFFVIEVAEDEWAELSDEQRIALVDHELHHCVYDTNDFGEPALSIAPHDVEEFAAVIRRHGLWKPDVEHFGRVILDQGEQLKLVED